MRHFLAYGNSDQASFRDGDVRGCFDFMTVPGTIASYYPDATAAFVLSSDIPYLIDPRTPLFQGVIHSPRASHFSLAEWLAVDLNSLVYTNGGEEIADFSPAFYEAGQLTQSVQGILDVQFNYGGRSASIRAKLDRYRALLLEALGEESDDQPDEVSQPPSFVLAPYFMSMDETDPWWDVNRAIWGVCETDHRREGISPVVAVTRVDFLGQAMAAPPATLAASRFFWISNFDERRVAATELAELASVVASADPSHNWINLYGGFFSIALGAIGLWGMSNGLGYSESRAWPQLEATGGAPPRYYIPRLHAYSSVASAQLLYEIEPWFFEPVMAQRTVPKPIPALSYHELKRDFALARRWELQVVTGVTTHDIADGLEEERDRYEAVRSQVPVRIQADVTYLGRWIDVLRGY